MQQVILSCIKLLVGAAEVKRLALLALHWLLCLAAPLSPKVNKRGAQQPWSKDLPSQLD